MDEIGDFSLHLETRFAQRFAQSLARTATRGWAAPILTSGDLALWRQQIRTLLMWLPMSSFEWIFITGFNVLRSIRRRLEDIRVLVAHCSRIDACCVSK